MPLFANRKSHFWLAWLRSPSAVGAIAPSSQALCRAMTAHINIHLPGYVIELGAGTGVITRAILKRRVNPEKLLVIESDRKLAHLLKERFPHLAIRCEDADGLQALAAKEEIYQVNAVVSGLPFRSLPREKRDNIQQQIAGLLGKHSVLVQFTYSPFSPIPKRHWRQLGIVGKRKAIIWANMPPAAVWVYRRLI